MDMAYLAFTLPGNQVIKPPSVIPSGGLPVVAKVVANSITILLILAVVLSLIFLIWGGAQWIASGGDKAKISAARGRITYAIIGLIVTLVAFFLVGFIGYLFQV